MISAAGFADLSLINVFFKKKYFILYLIFEEFFYFIQIRFILLKNSYFKIIFIICLALHKKKFPFILFTQFYMCFYFNYLFIDFNKQIQ